MSWGGGNITLDKSYVNEPHNFIDFCPYVFQSSNCTGGSLFRGFLGSIDFLFFNKSENSSNKSNFIQALEASEHVQFPALKRECERFICHEVMMVI